MYNLFGKKNNLSLLKRIFLLERVSFAKSSERSFEGFPFRVVGRRYNKYLEYANYYDKNWRALLPANFSFIIVIIFVVIVIIEPFGCFASHFHGSVQLLHCLLCCFLL